MTSHIPHPWWCHRKRCTAERGGAHRSRPQQWRSHEGHTLTAVRVRTTAGQDLVELGIIAQLHPTIAEDQSRFLVCAATQALQAAVSLDDGQNP
jgi:hypothetical protein